MGLFQLDLVEHSYCWLWTDGPAHYNMDIPCTYFDFLKAFDSVLHNHLLRKLLVYGKSGTLHCWLWAFVTNRIQRVVLTGWSELISGVLQGLILGPLLFILFVNIPMLTRNSIMLFADDIKLFSQVCSQQDADGFQEDINHLVHDLNSGIILTLKNRVFYTLVLQIIIQN